MGAENVGTNRSGNGLKNAGQETDGPNEPCYVEVSRRKNAALHVGATRLVSCDNATFSVSCSNTCHHRSNGDCLESKRENSQVCSVQYCVQ